MAGSFGYEAEYYKLSKAIGGVLFDQVETSPDKQVVATSSSCRTRLGDRPSEDRPPHPVEMVRDALAWQPTRRPLADGFQNRTNPQAAGKLRATGNRDRDGGKSSRWARYYAGWDWDDRPFSK